MVCFLDVFGLGVLAHGLSCFVTYLIGFRPIANYCGCVFMLYELSTPFLNIRWFFDKLGMTSTKAQFYNGLLRLVVFFCCRLVWGLHSSVNLFVDVWNAWHEDFYSGGGMEVVGSREEIMMYGMDRSLPGWLVALYGAGHVQGLNVWWFGNIIAAVRKRFVKPKEKKTQ